MSSARRRTLEEIIRRYMERYPERVDLMVSLMEFWLRLHSLNENVTALLNDMRHFTAEQRAAADALDNRATIVELPPDAEEEQQPQQEDHDDAEGAVGGQPR